VIKPGLDPPNGRREPRPGGPRWAQETCGREKGNMRHIRTILVFALPIAFGALLSKYGLHLGLDGSGTNFTW